MDRRQFFQNASLLSFVNWAQVSTPTSKKKIVAQIGICTDVHHGLIPDSESRLSSFIDEMNRLKPDFIIQLGDFCFPKESSQSFINIWKGFKGAAYHVIGNHDTDGGFSHQQVVDFWQMPAPYYSFDKNGFHFVVLNGNEKNPIGQLKGYPRYVSKAQRQWLKQDLATTHLPVIIFCHQGLDNDNNGIENATAVKLILEEANQNAGSNKVKLVLSGHHHQDYHNVINGIHYVQINSMSYFWVGDKNKSSGYDAETEKKFPYLKSMAVYKDPLWARLIIYSDGHLEIQGKKSQFLGDSPASIDEIASEVPYAIVPYISDRKF